MVALRSVVVGTGSSLPARAVTNVELEERVETSDAWIVQRTGIRQRYLADASETTSVLGARAARAADQQHRLCPACPRPRHRMPTDAACAARD